LGEKPAIEYAVKMRRFASGKLMDKLLAQGAVTPQHMDSLAATVAHFHSGLPAAPPGSAYGTAAKIRAAAMQNFEQLQPLLPDAEDRRELSLVGQLSEAESAGCEHIFSERRAQGWVRECHGDLHLGNIALIGTEPVPFDGIEFNADLRWLDVMNEAAFPVMDLLYRGHPELAWRFLNAYLEHTGDYAGIATLRFYLAYHAMVRAKVGAIRAAQPDVSGRTRTRDFADCRRYLALAGQCLQQRRPALIIAHGLPGSGKTTFAQMALERLGAIRIRSDVERKRLFGLAPLADSRAGPNLHSPNIQARDIYTKDATRHTYARLEELARAILAAGFPVIVDAAFLRRGERDRFHAIAQTMGAPFAIAALHASDAVLRARIAARRAGARDASEADEQVLAQLQAAEEPLAADELLWSAEFFNAENAPAGAAPESWSRLQALLGYAMV
jgi:aminoglycoside phosphotransferase family enzyme/predicted kinase